MGFHIALRQVSLVLAVLCTTAWAQEGHSQAQGAQGAQGAAPGGRCSQGRYWSAPLRRCVECSHCSGPGREVMLRPCDGARDAHCGSFTDLHIDWSWLRERLDDHLGDVRDGRDGRGKKKGVHERINSLSEAEALLRDELRHMPPPQHGLHGQNGKVVDFGDDYILPDHPRQPHAHHKKGKKHKKHRLASAKPFGDYEDFADFGASGDVHVDVSDDEDLALATWRRSHRNRVSTTAASTSTTTPPPTTTSQKPPSTTVNLVEDFIVEKDADRDEDIEARPVVDVVATTQTFSTAETLVWDWQAGVLVAAVCACLLFFIVAAAYSCQHALHFKKLKKHLDADMEEISARLALMAGLGSEHLQDAGPPSEKDAFAVRRGDHLHIGRQQNEYCLATLPRKSRV